MSSKVLFEPGDRTPVLELVRAERILPGDIVWGWQWQPNLRKGFILETEGSVCEKGALPGSEGYVTINNMALQTDYMVLIEVRS